MRFPVVLSRSFLLVYAFNAHGFSQRSFIDKRLPSHLKEDAGIVTETEGDTRPFAQRVEGPRSARRMNHAFRYLYRHNDLDSLTTLTASDASNLSAASFLIEVIGYTPHQVHNMNQTFPPLLTLDVQRHLLPKLRFAQHTLGLVTMQQVRDHVPPPYFGARLERILAPRHAFLVHYNLHHDLIVNKKKWEAFLQGCRKPKQFVALCNQWIRESATDTTATTSSTIAIDIHQVQAFDMLFQRGLMAAARNETTLNNEVWCTNTRDTSLNITSPQLTKLLIQHGANPLERDAQGSSLLHWAAGTGNLETVKVLISHLSVHEKTRRDGATPLHWAAAGANKQEFGIGGYELVCRYLLGQAGHDAKSMVNQCTKDGNSALMWAAWAKSLEVVKLLVRHTADPHLSNRNGCTVAHWAASGGSLECCQYLRDTVGVDFCLPNHGGNTPLTHAVAFGRANIVKWLREEVLLDRDTYNDDQQVAASLAREFVDWTNGDTQRQQVLSLFEDWYGGGGEELANIMMP